MISNKCTVLLYEYSVRYCTVLLYEYSDEFSLYVSDLPNVTISIRTLPHVIV